MRLMNVNALSVAQTDQGFALLRKGDELSLVSFADDLSVITELVSFRGTRGHILLGNDSELLLSIDNNLILIRNKTHITVLKASNAEYTFWHAAKINDTVMVHEYGLGRTLIYASQNLTTWRKVVSNLDIDRHSKHFHNIVYDPYRDQIIATLGDGNYVRAVHSCDGGSSWQPLFRGTWQFLPVVPLKDKIVFGLDSGLANGGLGIYDPAKDNWEFTFLKWLGPDIRMVQMCDLKRLETGLWIAALGTPQAIVVSEDLKEWYPLHVESFNNDFNYWMSIAEGKTHAACSTGQNLVVFKKAELTGIGPTLRPVLANYGAYTCRLKGVGSVLKRKFENMFFKKPKYGSRKANC